MLAYRGGHWRDSGCKALLLGAHSESTNDHNLGSLAYSVSVRVSAAVIESLTSLRAKFT